MRPRLRCRRLHLVAALVALAACAEPAPESGSSMELPTWDTEEIARLGSLEDSGASLGFVGDILSMRAGGAIAAALAVVVAGGCGAEDVTPAGPQLSDSAGVRIVRHAAEATDPSLDLGDEPLLQVGLESADSAPGRTSDGSGGAGP